MLPAFFSITSIHLILGLPFALFLSNGVHSVVFLAHSWFFHRALSPARLPLPSSAFWMTSFTFVLAHKSSFLILSPFVTSSIASYIRSCMPANLSLWRVVNDQGSVSYVFAGSIMVSTTTWDNCIQQRDTKKQKLENETKPILRAAERI